MFLKCNFTEKIVRNCTDNSELGQFFLKACFSYLPMGKQNIKMALKNRKVPGMVKYCSKIGYSLSPITRNPQVAERVKP